MQAYVRARLQSNVMVTLFHGDIIGRVDSAALVIDDPRVSEAHAMVSLRKGSFTLLSLRRMVLVNGTAVSEVALAPGLTVTLAEGVAIVFEEVVTPQAVMALESAQLGRRMLAQVSSFVDGTPPRLVGRFEPSAQAYLWTTGHGWKLQIGDAPARDACVGDSFEIGDQQYTLCLQQLADLGHGATDPNGAIATPVHITAAYDTVEIRRDGRDIVRLNGISARIVSELVIFEGPVYWELLAREVWSGDVDVRQLRHRWDVALGRLRQRLRAAGIRTDLVTTDGGGQVWLALATGDKAHDRT